MKNLYLILTIIGFIAPNIWVAMVSVETGNILFWLKPMETMAGMFPNKIATAFMVDLLFVVLVFFIWSYHEAKKWNMKTPWLVWVLTMLFGIAGALPLFLYQRQARIEGENS